MNKAAVILCLLLFNINCKAQHKLSFEKEDITFEIENGIFTVRGIYYFNSDSEKEYSILYPFPTDTIYGNPFKIEVSYINSNKNIEYKTTKDSSAVFFRILANPEQPILITYSQRLKTNKARYILLSTNQWHKPLIQADYKLITPLNFSITSLSVKPDKEIQIDNKKIYLWHKENFMPQKDFIVEFE